MDDLLERARQIFQENLYFTLGTVDADGPWTAPLAFTICGPHDLYFTSQRSSRHTTAILMNENVAGTVFNSAGTDASKIDCVQFSGQARVIPDDDLEYFLERAAKFNRSVDANEKLTRIRGASSVVLVHVRIDNGFVLDQEAYRRQGIDARQEFSIDALFSPR